MAAPQPEEHLSAYAGIQRTADREILAALRLAYRDVGSQLGALARAGGNNDASLQRQRLLAVKKAILEAQAEFYERAGKVIDKRRVQAAARAIQVSGRYDQAVFARAGRGADLRALSESLEETEARAPDALVARLTGSRTPLSARVYRTQAYTQGLLDRRINSALARGLNAQEFAREVRDLVDPNTPGGVRYAALRLARTEINNAYHAMAIRAAELKPWVTGCEWHTSDSHPRPDRCDELNKQVFSPPSETPVKPHPQCMCYVTQVIGDPEKTDQENDDEFLDDLVDGLFDEVLAAAEQPGGVAAFVDNNREAPEQIQARRERLRAAKARAAAFPQVPEVPELGAAPENRDISTATVLVPRRHRGRIRAVLNRQAVIAPRAASRLNSVEVGATQRESSMAEYHPRSRSIVIAERTMRYGDDYQRAMEDSGWKTRCGHDHGTAEAAMAHEFGHHVHLSADWSDDDTRRLVDVMVNTMGVSRPPTYRMNSKAFKAWMAEEDTAQRMADFVSQYGATSLEEFLAECWTEYSTRDSPRQVTLDIGALMKEVSER